MAQTGAASELTLLRFVRDGADARPPLSVAIRRLFEVQLRRQRVSGLEHAGKRFRAYARAAAWAGFIVMGA